MYLQCLSDNIIYRHYFIILFNSVNNSNKHHYNLLLSSIYKTADYNSKFNHIKSGFSLKQLCVSVFLSRYIL